MTRLTIHCQFIAHSYSGVRPDGSNGAQLDWPPAPARLHQAMIAVTLANLPESLREPYAGKALAALKRLETLPPPEIIASKLAADAADDNDGPRSVLVAMPHNSRAKGDPSRYLPDLAPVFRATPAHDAGLQVSFRWTSHEPEFHRVTQEHLPALKDILAKMRYLGRAEDRVECDVLRQVDENDAAICESMEIWRPSNIAEDVRLWTARRQSTFELMNQFESNNSHSHAHAGGNGARRAVPGKRRAHTSCSWPHRIPALCTRSLARG